MKGFDRMNFILRINVYQIYHKMFTFTISKQFSLQLSLSLNKLIAQSNWQKENNDKNRKLMMENKSNNWKFVLTLQNPMRHLL